MLILKMWNLESELLVTCHRSYTICVPSGIWTWIFCILRQISECLYYRTGPEHWIDRGHLRVCESVIFGQFWIACLVSYSLYNMAIHVKIKSKLLGSREHQQSLEVLKSAAQMDMLNLQNTGVITQLMGDIKPRANIE